MGHHHHKRGHDCPHGWWATSDDAGHHHHKLGHDCSHGVWATDSVDGHHHHKRGGDCVEHHQWATGENVADRSLLTDEEFPDDPTIEVDLSTTDRRSYAEIEAEMAALDPPQ